MGSKYLVDRNNDDLAVTAGFFTRIGLTFKTFPVNDITGDTIKFWIGEEGEAAILDGTATIVDATLPDMKIEIDIPSGTFTQALNRVMLQLSWNDGANERIIAKRHFDVRDAVKDAP